MRIQATCTLLFGKHSLKLAPAVRKTKTKIDQASQLSFSMIVGVIIGSCYRGNHDPSWLRVQYLRISCRLDEAEMMLMYPWQWKNEVC